MGQLCDLPHVLSCCRLSLFVPAWPGFGGVGGHLRRGSVRALRSTEFVHRSSKYCGPSCCDPDTVLGCSKGTARAENHRIHYSCDNVGSPPNRRVFTNCDVHSARAIGFLHCIWIVDRRKGETVASRHTIDHRRFRAWQWTCGLFAVAHVGGVSHHGEHTDFASRNHIRYPVGKWYRFLFSASL